MALHIPKEEIPAVVKICGLPEELLEELVGALQAAPITPVPGEMAAHVSKHVSGIAAKDLSQILDTLYTLYHIREFSEVSPERFLKDLLEGIREIDAPDLPSTRKEVAKTRDRFKKLLNLDTINMPSKAIGLQRDGERLYCRAKILSDIRPVFTDDPNAPPAAAVITHTLKLSYHHPKEHDEFFVVLDSEDLLELKRTVDRAISKSKSIHALLEQVKLPDLGT